MAFSGQTFTFEQVLTSSIMNQMDTNIDEVRVQHKGSSAPAELAAGVEWIDDTVSPWTKKVYDGAGFIDVYDIDPTNNLIVMKKNLLARSSVLAPHSNLMITNSTAAATLDINADALVLTDANDAQCFVQSLDLTVNMATNGINGCPITSKAGTFSTAGTAVTGSLSSFLTEFAVGDVMFSDTESEGRRITAIASSESATLASSFGTNVPAGEPVKRNGEAPSTYYHIWAIETGSAVAAILDTSEISPDLTSAASPDLNDYIFSGLLGALINDSNKDFANILQKNTQTAHARTAPLVDGGAVSLTALDLTLHCPPSAVSLLGFATCANSMRVHL